MENCYKSLAIHDQFIKIFYYQSLYGYSMSQLVHTYAYHQLKRIHQIESSAQLAS